MLPPDYVKSTRSDRHELILVCYSDSPRFEVRLYSTDLPHDHRTFIVTDSFAEAERTYKEQSACI